MTVERCQCYIKGWLCVDKSMRVLIHSTDLLDLLALELFICIHAEANSS